MGSARESVEEELAGAVAPVLGSDASGEDLWHAFDDAIASARTGELFFVRSSEGWTRDAGDGTPARMASLVTIIGPDGGQCVAVSVSADGTARSIVVSGDPVDNCDDARLPPPLLP